MSDPSDPRRTHCRSDHPYAAQSCSSFARRHPGAPPPPSAARRGLSAARPPPLRCAHGSGPPRPTRESRSHGRPARSGCVLRAARSSRLRPRIAPGSVRPAAPSAPRGGRMLRAPPSVARTARIHSLRVRCGLTSVNLREGRVGPSQRRALRYGSRAAAPSRSSAAGSVVTPARRRASRREARARARRCRGRGRLRQPRCARSGSAGPGRGCALSDRWPFSRRPPRRPRRARRCRRAPRASRARPRATRPDRRRGPSPSG